MRILTPLLAAGTALALLAGPAQAAPAALDLQHVSSYVDLVTVMPGERFPLRVTDAEGQNVAIKWRATGGAVAHASNAMAIWKAPLKPGVHTLTGTGTVDGKPVTRTLQMVVAVPASNVRSGKLNGYPIGTYPKGHQSTSTMLANRGVRSDQAPGGFIELTMANANTAISRHYKLGDFQGKDSWAGGKKYLFVNAQLVEKLERAIDSLHAKGFAAGKLELMSAYRSPWLNAAIGNTTSLSRHTYGDAADVLAQDFNRDGKVDLADALILKQTFDQLDGVGHLTGGLSLYNPNAAHGYFVHTDTRGYMARW